MLTEMPLARWSEWGHTLNSTRFGLGIEVHVAIQRAVDDNTLASDIESSKGELAAMRRRRFIRLQAGALFFLGRPTLAAQTTTRSPQMTLLSVPLELVGAWSEPLTAPISVLSLVREVSLSNVRLRSDDQPSKIRIDNHSSGPPAIWLHDDHTKVAWIIVDISSRDWSRLAYQFGHELGHVLCNSWEANSKPQPPSHWIEEAMVEAFSIRGLGLLAKKWESAPPFEGDAGFAAAIRQYRANVVASYTTIPALSNLGLSEWFHNNRSSLEKGGGLSPAEGPLVLAILDELERDTGCVEDLGAVNRWEKRTAVPIEEYFNLWEKSCAEIHTSGRLPTFLRGLLRPS